MTAVFPTEFSLQVRHRRECATGVVELELVHPARIDLPAWTPGAHIDLVLDSGLVRQYSLCGDPDDRQAWRIAILREPDGRGGSQYVHDHLKEGDDVRVRGPRNHFELRPASKFIFIAGGIGITPILPMVTQAEASGQDWQLIYGGRTRESMAYADHLQDTFGSRVELVPQDSYGLLDVGAILGEPELGKAVYCCGPEPLLDAVTEHCRSWPDGNVRIERFVPQESANHGDSTPFEIELSATGVTLTVPADRSILDVVLDEGIDALTSCGEGTCGTCEIPVLEGSVDHRDSVLDASERAANATMMICVSRAACSRLVLDL